MHSCSIHQSQPFEMFARLFHQTKSCPPLNENTNRFTIQVLIITALIFAMCRASNNSDTTVGRKIEGGPQCQSTSHSQNNDDMIIKIIGSISFDKRNPPKLTLTSDCFPTTFGFQTIRLCTTATPVPVLLVLREAYDNRSSSVPTTRLYITATPVPLLLALKKESLHVPNRLSHSLRCIGFLAPGDVENKWF